MVVLAFLCVRDISPCTTLYNLENMNPYQSYNSQQPPYGNSNPQQPAYGNNNVSQQSNISPNQKPFYPQNNSFVNNQNFQQSSYGQSYGQPAYGDSQQTPFLKQQAPNPPMGMPMNPQNPYGFDAFNNPTAQLGLQIGSQAYHQTEEMVKKNVCSLNESFIWLDFKICGYLPCQVLF
jgi:hypothetical protein